MVAERMLHSHRYKVSEANLPIACGSSPKRKVC